MSPETASRLRSWATGALLHLSIAIGLTVFLLGARWTRFELFITVVANLAFSVSIGTLCVLFFRHVLPRIGATGWRKALLIASGFALCVGVGVEIALLVLQVLSLELHGSRLFIWRIAGVVSLAVLVVSLAFDRMRDHARAVELREEQARRELLEAQLSNLRSRLNPHFLFNSLNTLAGLIEEDPPRAVQALERLCDLLRHALESSTTRRTSLTTELSILEDYLAMEQLRFGERLRWELDVDLNAQDAVVPTLLLQPIVENAVKYAVASRRDGGEIRIAARVERGRLLLGVRDDGPGHTDAPGTGVGHETLQQRLALEYGADASVRAGPDPTGGYRVDVELPMDGDRT